MALPARTSYTCLRCLARPRVDAITRRLSHASAGSNPLRRPPASQCRAAKTKSQPTRTIVTRDANSLPQPEQPTHDPRFRPGPSGNLYAWSDGPENENLVLPEHDLFHPYSRSPIPDIRRRAAVIRHSAWCPHPSHRQTRVAFAPFDPEARKSPGPEAAPAAKVKYECPDCGIPVACCEAHYADDYETHLEFCDLLRQINEDDHDLHSGRHFEEFDMQGPLMAEAVVNMANWDALNYTRQYKAINGARPLRQITRSLTYPVTIASVLHELSPYTIKEGGRMTSEGLKSFTALHYNLHPDPDGRDGTLKNIRPTAPPVRLFILGARAESSIPRPVWQQLAFMFPRANFHLIFLGPDSMVGREREFPMPAQTPLNPFGAIVEDRLSEQMKISTFIGHFHTIQRTGYFAPFDPYFDCFVLFHPGLGHPASSHEWQETLPLLLKSKCPVIATGYTEWDMERDRKWVEEEAKGEYDLLIEPGENRFRSLRWDLNDLEPYDVTCGNWGVWAFRGKRYEATYKGQSSGYQT